jgi:hypothetical protein
MEQGSTDSAKITIKITPEKGRAITDNTPQPTGK